MPPRRRRRRPADRRQREAAAPPHAAPPCAGASPAGKTADTPLGELALRLLPGPAYYAPALLYPIGTLLAGLGAAYAPAAAQFAAGLPLVRAAGLAPALQHVATAQPWATLLCVAGSLVTAAMAFVAMPVLDFALGSDLRNPSEVGGRRFWAAA